jgi:hypothetical protein
MTALESDEGPLRVGDGQRWGKPPDPHDIEGDVEPAKCPACGPACGEAIMPFTRDTTFDSGGGSRAPVVSRRDAAWTC